jgi:uncharacterized BrkB/YihY/UPF0761 family membrane protein
MQFSCAIFLAAVIGIAGAILASLSLLFWQARSPRNLQPDETSAFVELEAIEESQNKRHSTIATPALPVHIW